METAVTKAAQQRRDRCGKEGEFAIVHRGVDLKGASDVVHQETPTVEWCMDAPDDLPEDSQESYRPRRRDGGEVPGADLAVGGERRPGSGTNLLRWFHEPEQPPRTGSAEEGAPLPYRLLRPIGSGGYGEVWEATQTALNRTVAVKRLREELHLSAESTVTSLEYDTTFRQEAFTTARLEHPNIVPIHDLGLDEHGRPLLAMKLVRGRSWRELIDEDFGNMPTTEYLEKHLPILIDVTQAVAFAHSRGIAHRDLKPTQVMVGEYGEALLMDWGLAVVFDGKMLEQSGHGGAESFLSSTDSASSPAGTPAFMAPEQTDHDARRIGPWTDVYLLGGCLFYLLTGRTPHGSGAPHWVFQKAKEGIIEHLYSPEMDEHPAGQLVNLARRATVPAINQRMQSAREFLAVLNDFMTGASRRRESIDLAEEAARTFEAALAQPSYETLTTCLAQLDRARYLWAGNGEAAALRERVIESYARAALRTGDLALARAQAGTLPPGPEKEELLVRCERAEAISQAHRVQRRALLVTTAVLAFGLLGFAWKYSSDQRTARLNLQRQVELATAARADSEELLNFMLGDLREKVVPIGRSDVIQGVAEKAHEYLQRLEQHGGALDNDDHLRRAITLRLIGYVHADTGEAERGASEIGESLRILREQIDLRPANGAVRSELVESQLALSSILLRQGRSADALAAVDEALATLVTKELDIGSAAAQRLMQLECLGLMSRALLLRIMGRREEALETAISAGAALQRLDHAGRSINRIARMSAQNHRTMGDTLRDLGRLDEAQQQYELAVEVAGELSEKNPLSFTYQSDLGVFLDRLGDLHLLREEYVEAKPVYQRSLEIRKRLVHVDPRSINWKREYLMSLDRVANIERLTGNPEGAREPTMEALRGRQQIMQDDPDNPRAWHEVANSLLQKGFLHSALKETEQMRDAYEQARVLLRQCVESDPANTRWAEEYVEATNRVMIAFITLKDGDRGVDYIEESQSEVKRIVQRFPDNPDILDERVTCWYQASMICRQSNRFEEAVHHISTAMAMAAEMSASPDLKTRQMGEVWKGELEWHRAAVHAEAGDPAEAWKWLEQALESGIEDYQMDNVRELAEELRAFDEEAYGRVEGKLKQSVRE